MNPTPEIIELLRRVKFVVFDFDGVFTDNRVLVSEDGTESVLCCRSDGIGLSRLRELDIELLILSTEVNTVVVKRAEKLRIACIHGVPDKLHRLREEIADRKLRLEETAYIGNDINDADCLKAVGLPVVPADAWDAVKPLAKLVLTRRGGEGAVREFCDLVWGVKRKG